MSFLYLNPGYGNLFNEAGQNSYTQVLNADSKTGKSFYSCGTRTVTLPANLKEIWVRYDYHSLSGNYNGTSNVTVKSTNRNARINHGSYAYDIVYYLHDIEKGRHSTTAKWNRFLIHIKTGVEDGVFEIWEGEIVKCSFSGNVLNGENILTCNFYSDTSNKPYSQIIVSDSPIKWTENVIILPTSISATMADNGDGTYSATNSGEYVKQTIDRDALRNLCTDNTVITGICIAGRPAYRDGEGIDVMQAVEGDTVLGECSLYTNDYTSITYGKRVNMPISTVSGTYGWKAK